MVQLIGCQPLDRLRQTEVAEREPRLTKGNRTSRAQSWGHPDQLYSRRTVKPNIRLVHSLAEGTLNTPYILGLSSKKLFCQAGGSGRPVPKAPGGSRQGGGGSPSWQRAAGSKQEVGAGGQRADGRRRIPAGSGQDAVGSRQCEERTGLLVGSSWQPIET